MQIGGGWIATVEVRLFQVDHLLALFNPGAESGEDASYSDLRVYRKLFRLCPDVSLIIA